MQALETKMLLVLLLLLLQRNVVAELGDFLKKDDTSCGKKFPYYHSVYDACVQCRTSKDCSDDPLGLEGYVCYNGACSVNCPTGMRMEYQAVAPELYEFVNIGEKEVPVEDRSDLAEKLFVADSYKRKLEIEKNQDPNTPEDEKIPEDRIYPMHVCVCDTNAKFITATNEYNGEVIYHPFSTNCACNAKDGFCNIQIQVRIWGKNFGSEALVPKGRPGNCYGITADSSFRFYASSFGASIIVILAYRSTSNMLWDFHRMNIYNVIGTMSFLFLLVIADPHLVGYTRFLGFGIVAHNAAEWNFMIRLWFGTRLQYRRCMAMWQMFYLVTMILMIVLMSMQLQLLIVGTLGAMLDSTWLLMLYPMHRHLYKDDQNKLSMTNSTVMLWGLASLMHHGALYIIFNAMSSGDISLFNFFAATFFSMAQFLILEIFAFANNRRVVSCGPYAGSSFDQIKVQDKEAMALIVTPANTSTGNVTVMDYIATDEELTLKKEGTEVALDDDYIHDTDHHLRCCTRSCCCKQGPLKESGDVPENIEKAITIRDNGIYQKGLAAYEPRWCSYFALGLFIAFIANSLLFVIQPRFNVLDGKCPNYYPVLGNQSIPNWMHVLERDSWFLDLYAHETYDGYNNLVFVATITISVYSTIFFMYFFCTGTVSYEWPKAAETTDEGVKKVE